MNQTVARHTARQVLYIHSAGKQAETQALSDL